MGELSKKIGDKGELLVKNFLNVLGWSDLPECEQISCNHPGKHANTSKSRTTHGVDLFYSSRSNLQDFTLDNVVISVKYSSKPYPAAPSAKFKEHLKDLAQQMECFISSNFRADSNETYELSGINSVNDTGILLWLNNDKKSDQDVVSKICNISLDKDLVFSSIQVVDNARASFIYDSISFVRNTFKDCEVFFHYSFSSVNFKDPAIEKYGKRFPVEYMTSNLIPFRIINGVNKENKFCLVVREEFSEECISRLFSLSSDISLEFSSDFVFVFPDYDVLEHEMIVKRAKQAILSRNSNISISVMSYSNDFRNLING